MTIIKTTNNDLTTIASDLYSDLLEVTRQLHVVSGRTAKDLTIRGHLSWKSLNGITDNPHISVVTRQKLMTYIELAQLQQITAAAIPKFHQDVTHAIESNVRNYHIFNAAQVDEALKVILDSEYLPENTAMLIFRRDPALADGFLDYCTTDPRPYSFEERGGLSPL